MGIFDKKEVEGNKVIYEIAKDKLEDLGEEEGKSCYTLGMLDALMDKYPDKEDALQSIYNYVLDLAENSWKDVESLIVLKGMNKILFELDKVLYDEK